MNLKSNKQKVKMGVAVIVLEGEYVLMHIRKGSHRNGTWSFPGGHIDSGEFASDAAVRELEEETGLKVSKKDIKYKMTTLSYFEEIDTEYATSYFLVNRSDCTGRITVKEPHKVYGEWEYIRYGEWPTPLFDTIELLPKNLSGLKE